MISINKCLSLKPCSIEKKNKYQNLKKSLGLEDFLILLKFLLAIITFSCSNVAWSITETAEDIQEWRTTSTLESWFYRTSNGIKNDSVLNPKNSIANILSQSDLIEARFNLRAENESFQLVANPKFTAQKNKLASSTENDEYNNSEKLELAQGFIRYHQNDSSVTLGRELFVWGPANFRSPSNQFYFDAGHVNPLAGVSGVDLARITQKYNDLRITGAYVFSSNQLRTAEHYSDTKLFKIDQQGSNHLMSLIFSQKKNNSPFIGGYIQYTPADAWLLYSEFGSSRNSTALIPNTSELNGTFYNIQTTAKRNVRSLVGVNYTLENGQALNVEYLHDTGGYNSSQTNAYFLQAINAGKLAETQPTISKITLVQALTQAPRLLGRNYLSINWQSNPQESDLLWRLGIAKNFTDNSNQFSFYLEKNLTPKLSSFMSLSVNHGSIKSEYGSLVKNNVTFGFKWFAF